jgi:hypothetical protein
MSSRLVKPSAAARPSRSRSTSLTRYVPSSISCRSMFTTLGSDALTGREIAEHHDLQSRAVYDVLDGLVALHLLDRDGRGEQALYRNTPDTALFLDAMSPAYIGGILEMANDRLYGLFAEPLPPADLITMGKIIHDWNLERKLQLIRAAYEALPAGDALIAIENIIDDDRRHNVFGLMMTAPPSPHK